MLSDSAILKKIAQQSKHAAGFKQLARELGLRGEQRRELNDRLDRLVSGGQLVKVDSDRYAMPSGSAGKNMIVGRLSMHRDGYGFVQPDPKSAGDRFKNLAGDIFIPPESAEKAMHGDRVVVRIARIEVGVVVVGAGPAGLACAVRFGQLLADDPPPAAPHRRPHAGPPGSLAS